MLDWSRYILGLSTISDHLRARRDSSPEVKFTSGGDPVVYRYDSSSILEMATCSQSCASASRSVDPLNFRLVNAEALIAASPSNSGGLGLAQCIREEPG